MHRMPPYFKRVVLHIGPTNSGKTHAALQVLRGAKSGLYAAPLRLLAHEIYLQLREAGVRTTLLTGQQQIVDEQATHVACTAEMVPSNRVFEVGVVDEIQCISSEDRGFAWTNALFNSKCETMYLCGASHARPLVERLTRDHAELHVAEFQRRSKLHVEKEPFLSLSSLRKGDCIVAFSRKQLYELRKQIGDSTSLIYGSLPPESKTAQAALFNEGHHRVLLASDAIGMGLNLNIRRIIFSSTSKFDGTEQRDLTASEVQQIAGRAGRGESDGFVTAMSINSLRYVRECLLSPPPPLERAGVSPTLEQLMLQGGGDVEEEASLYKLLEGFVQDVQMHADEPFFLCDLTDMMMVAKVVDRFRRRLSLKDRFTFAMSPFDVNDEVEMYYLVQFARAYADGERVPLGISIYQQKEGAAEGSMLDRLPRLESLYGAIDGYIWLAYRFGRRAFSEMQLAIQTRAECSQEIEKLLRLGFKPRSKRFAAKKKGGSSGKRRDDDDGLVDFDFD